jgi:hypothetical protein
MNSNNKTLESVCIALNSLIFNNEDIRHREVRSLLKRNATRYHLDKQLILQFKRERRRFEENARSYSNPEQLIQALASVTDNHHLLYWLVREHLSNIPRTERAQAQSFPSKATIIFAFLWCATALAIYVERR